MTTQQIPAELDTDRTRVLSRLVDINAQIADLTSEAEALKAELRDLTPGDYAVNGQPALRIIPTRRFDPAQGIALVPAERRQECLKVEPDATKVKSLLTPEQVESCMVEAGRPKVVMI